MVIRKTINNFEEANDEFASFFMLQKEDQASWGSFKIKLNLLLTH